MILQPTANGVRLRAGQSTAAAILATLSASAQVIGGEYERPLLGTPHWLMVTVAGKTGFIRGDLLREPSAAQTFVWPYARPLAGVQGPSNPSMDYWTEQAYADLKRSHLPAVKILANADVNGSVIDRLKADGVQAIVIRILNTIDSSKAKTGREYCEEVIEPTLRLYQAGARYFEVGNEPNLGGSIHEGMWVSWQNGAQFAEWWKAAVTYLKPLMPDAYFGFPAVSPGPAVDGLRYDPVRFMSEAASGIAQADFICQHVYWNNIDSSVYAAVQEVKRFAQAYPHKPFMVTEFSDVNAGVPKDMKGLEYVTFYSELKKLALPNLLASFCYTLSWGADANNEGWIGSPIADVVGQRISLFS